VLQEKLHAMIKWEKQKKAEVLKSAQSKDDRAG